MYGKHIFVIGLLLAFLGSYLMFDGQIFGTETTGIATVVGITGIGLIVTSGPVFSKIGEKKR